MVAERVTIYEVARAAGVSISTVSIALNRPSRVSEATRARVLEVADSLGYVPKAEAVSTARRGMRRIGVVAPFTSYVSFLQRLKGVLAVAAERGVEVSVFDHESAATASSPLLAGMPIRGQVDGLIVMGMRVGDVVEQRLFDRGMPVVVVDAESDRFPVVACDDVAGGRLAAGHLLRLGHHRFGYLVERQLTDYDSQARRRVRGVRSALDAAGGCTLTLVECGSSVEDARAAAMEVLRGPERPTAIMAHCDELAVGGLLAARDLGLDVPRGLAVMGYDDGPAAQAADLTTVRQPFEESGATAAGVLLAAIGDPAAHRTVTYLDLRVVQRSTTSPLEEYAPA
jgi:LacI family transcriptional regulator